jgi:hypothetical protein
MGNQLHSWNFRASQSTAALLLLLLLLLLLPDLPFCLRVRLMC